MPGEKRNDKTRRPSDSNRPPAKRPQQKGNERSSTGVEAWGIFLIALGLFLALSIYFIYSSLLGSFISDVMFGIIGLLSYAVPVTLIVLGVLRVINSTRTVVKRTSILVLLLVITIATLINVNLFPINSQSLFPYYGNAYTYSSAHHTGGGILGALLSYPLLLLLGTAGSDIMLAAALIIIVMFLTRISISETAEKIRKRSGKSRERRTVRERDMDYDEEPETRPSGKKKKQGIYIGTEDDIIRAVEDDDGLDYLPLSGEIPLQEDVPDAFDDLTPYDADYDDINSTVTFSNGGKRRDKKRSADDHILPTPFGPSDLSGVPLDTDEDEYDEEPAPPPFEYHPDPPASAPVPQKREIEPRDLGEEKAHPLPYQRPPYTLLKQPPPQKATEESPDEKAKTLVSTLASFKINAQVTNISVGPVITRFELQPALGVRVNSITALSNDIALALAAEKVRIEAPIPGKKAIGIEIPNKTSRLVSLREIIDSREFRDSRSPLTFGLGRDIAGKIVTGDLVKMPHLLIAGATGSGKSVCLNAIILSFIYRQSPEELRMILIDPKMVEFSVYEKLPHLLVPVVTDKRKAASALRWAVSEMERRYKEMMSHGAKDIARYNLLQSNPDDRMPKIVIVIDELAELMMAAAKEVEDSICRIAQLGRACGIHLVVATQRPSSDVITGLIKANIPSRIALAVSDSTNSRVILDMTGAEKLLGRGDLLFHASGTAKPVRVQCAYASDDEVEAIADFFDRTQTEPTFDSVADSQITAGVGAQNTTQEPDGEDESLFIEAVRCVAAHGTASASMLQRRLRVGYNRASRLIEEMEQRGIVSGFDGSRPRKLLISPEQLEEMYGGTAAQSDDNADE